MRDLATDRRQAKNALTQSMSVHGELLSLAERARYPIALDLLHLLQAAADHPAEPWQESWQAHLLAQLAKGRYASYETATLLWLVLLPQTKTLASWAANVTDHFTGSQSGLHRCARRILTMVSDAGSTSLQWDTYLLNDFDYLLSQQDADFIFRLEDRLGMRYRRFPQSWQDLRRLLQRVDDSSGGDLGKRYRQTLQNGTAVTDTYYPRSPALLRVLYAYQQVGSWQDPLRAQSASSAYQLESAENPDDVIGQASMEMAYQAEALGELRRIQDRRLLRRQLFTRAVGNHARALLTKWYEGDAGHIPLDAAAYMDLVVILRGRMIQLSEADKTNSDDSQEIEQGARTALALLAISSDARTVEACCNLLGSLPIRSAAELAVVLRLVANTQDSQIHEAYAHALLHATPRAPEDWTAFAGSVAAAVTTVQAAIDARLSLIYALDDQLHKLTEPRYQQFRAHPTIGRVAR